MSSKLKKEEEKRKREEERELERIKREEEKQEKLRQKEIERLKREDEKRKKDEEKEQERLKKEEEKRKKDEEREQDRLKKEDERVKREEEKRKKDEEKEQERLKREEEKRKKDEEKKQKDEEKEQVRVKREEERLKKEAEKKQKQEEKDREKVKLEEKAKQQAEFLKSFLNKTPGSRKSTASANSSILDQNGNASTLDSPGVSPYKDQLQNEDPEVVEISENDDMGEVRSPKIPRMDFHPMPFQVKNGMALAPVLRRASLNIFEKHSVDKMVHPTKLTLPLRVEDELDPITKPSVGVGSSPSESSDPVLVEMDLDKALPDLNVSAAPATAEIEVVLPAQPYLEFLKEGHGRKSQRTEVKHVREDADDIEIIDPRVILMKNPKVFGQVKLRYKLLQFHDNHRPAYWGTCRKQPLKITSRRPFAQEEDLDYEFESGDEWEEEPEDGEDLNSDNEVVDKEEEEKEGNDGGNDADEDMDEWMVPHGYLSDEEADGQHLDKDTLKSQEEEFYKQHKRQRKLGLPTIETDDLSDYEIMYVPKRRRNRKHKVRKTATEFYETLDEVKKGNVTFEGALLSSDEEDSDWEEAGGSSYDGDEGDKSSSDDGESESSDSEASEDDLLVKKDASLEPKKENEDDGISVDIKDDEEEDESMESSESVSESVSVHSEASENESEDENMDVLPPSTSQSTSLQETKCESESEPGLTV